MKTSSLLAATIAVAGFAFTARVHSQIAPVPQTPLQQLQALKLQNQQLLQQQAATLIKIDEVQKQATQLRFLAARS